MNKVVSGNRSLVKAVCFGLALILGACLSADGVMAASGCGVTCCCLSKPTSRHHAPQEQMRSSMGCCSGSQQMPCDLVAATDLQLPDISLTPSTVPLPDGVGSANQISDGLIDWHGLRVLAFDQRAQKNFRAPPLYLQNLSFLS